ncbi:hypothetical protein DXB47_14665 [Firmicutes bacterium OM04-13BH]|nr:hypothetical protein DW128_08575 [Firmicutes bacterium AM10-47]RHV41580.1 hypothetical protein DXB47_14665 [Firmicutes bacterium OM04-13BH]
MQFFLRCFQKFYLKLYYFDFFILLYIFQSTTRHLKAVSFHLQHAKNFLFMNQKRDLYKRMYKSLFYLSIYVFFLLYNTSDCNVWSVKRIR